MTKIWILFIYYEIFTCTISLPFIISLSDCQRILGNRSPLETIDTIYGKNPTLHPFPAVEQDNHLDSFIKKFLVG